MLAGLPLVFNQMQTVCTDSECLWGQPSITGLQKLATSGLSLTTYAAYNTLLPLVVPILSLALVTIVIWRKPNDRLALLFALVIGTCPVNLSNAPMALANAYPDFWLFAKVIEFGAAGFLPFFYLFPNGQFVPRWSRWLIFPNFLIVGLAVFLPVSQIPGTPTANLTGAWGVIAAVTTFLFQGYRYRYVANPVQRQQIKWLVYGLAMTTSTSILSSVLAKVLTIDVQPGSLGFLISNTLTTAAIAFFGISLWIAVLRYRLFDIDFLINRTLVYGALTAFVVGAYALVVGAVGALLQVEGNIVLSLIATGLVAVAFNPLRERLQRGVNRLMYGDRDDPYRALSRLGQRLEAAGESSAILATTVEAVAQTLKLPYVAIALKQNSVSGLQLVVAHGTESAPVTRFPLNYAGELVGEMIVAARAGEALNSADQRVLTDLARPIGGAAHAFRLTADLERARLRIVTAREETRRRLGNDLHDGVGHQLAGLARKAERATNLLERNPLAARALLAEVTGQLNVAITQVRGLAHQLHPPELEVLGLVGALRERAQTQNSLAIRVDAPEALPPLPTAVETAAYYIALEALTNVEKHAEARVCHIRLALTESSPPALELDITDDGHGLPAETSNGLGLLSMQARAAEVGGTCRIESNLHGGTRVSVRLPCLAQID